MVFTFLFEISDLWRHLAIFFNIFKIKPNVPFIGFGVKKWIILTIFSQNSSFFEVIHELTESIWKEFLAKIPVCSTQGSLNTGLGASLDWSQLLLLVCVMHKSSYCNFYCLRRIFLLTTDSLSFYVHRSSFHVVQNFAP